MNKIILMGRLTRDPDIRYSAGAEPMCIARYTLAVDRGMKKDNEPNADFISCVAFGSKGEFAEKYARKGTKLLISGHLQTGSYTNNQGVKVYTTDVIVDSQEFTEKRSDGESQNEVPSASGNGFMNISDEIQEELPFN